MVKGETILFGETKVYFDGSHYIAIPHTERPAKRRRIKLEETITVQDEVKDSVENSEPSISPTNEELDDFEEVIEDMSEDTEKAEKKPKRTRQLTKKELFNKLHTKYIDNTRKQRQKLIVKDMLPYFETKEYCENYVQLQMERKQRNLICRRIRMTRKANLVDFNYFCTFTYDDKKHTEQTFKKKLQTCFRTSVIETVGNTWVFGNEHLKVSDCTFTHYFTFQRVLWLEN